MPPLLHIRLLGSFGLEYDGAPVPQVDTARMQSLLAYLLLHADAPQPRQYLAFRFWPDSTEKQARTNLRQLLHHLRQSLPDADRLIEARTHTLQWRPAVPWVLDVDAFAQALARADAAGEHSARRQALEDASRLYRGDLLPACYDEWIEPERERLRQHFMAALDRLVGVLEEARAYPEAIRYAGRLLQKDPLREAAYRTLMRLHALRDDRASALRVYHECATVMERELGVVPSHATRALYERLVRMEAPAGGPAGPPAPAAELPLVGRHPEWDQLRAAWRAASGTGARMALIEGEAGIGKSRLAEELLTWAARQGVPTARSRCYAAEGRLAFAPVADWLRTEAFQSAVETLGDVRHDLARILPELQTAVPERSSLEPLPESWQRRHLFETLARTVLAAPQPMILMIDDLQWCDQDTLEWLHYLLRFDAGARLLLLGTMRIEEVGPEHPCSALLRALRPSGILAEITLGPLSAEETAALAGHVAADAITADQAEALHRETEGNPLFVVESVRAQQGGRPETPPSHSPSAHGPEGLPPRVQAILSARLAQCAPEAHALAHLAAVVGRAFTFDVLAAASGLREDALIRSLDELWQRRIVREYGPGAYDFSHDKLREVAYAEGSPVFRRQMHRRVAEALESLHADALDGVSGTLATHYERAGLPERAIPYHRRAARVAQRAYANEEAIVYLNRALTLLGERPAGLDRDLSELALLVHLGASVSAARGYAAEETGRVYARARELCRPEADPHLLFPVYWGSYGYHIVRAELGKAHAFSEQCRRLAEAEGDPALLVAAHFAVGVSLTHLGELTHARAHLEQAHARYVPGQHHFQMGTDPGVFSRAYSSHALWLLGYPDQALQQAREALARAEALAHPFSRVIAHSYLAMLHQFRGDGAALLPEADAALALAADHRFPYYEAWATIMQGWAVHRQGDHERGRAGMAQGLRRLRAIGTGAREPYYLALLVEAHHAEGAHDDARTLLAEALRVVALTEERWQEADLHRLQGDLMLHEDVEKAEACYRRALRVARQQQARSLELRAALHLGRLWHRQRRLDEARTLVHPILEAFDEGCDETDLLQARELLDAVS